MSSGSRDERISAFTSLIVQIYMCISYPALLIVVGNHKRRQMEEGSRKKGAEAFVDALLAIGHVSKGTQSNSDDPIVDMSTDQRHLLDVLRDTRAETAAFNAMSVEKYPQVSQSLKQAARLIRESREDLDVIYTLLAYVFLAPSSSARTKRSYPDTYYGNRKLKKQRGIPESPRDSSDD